MAKVYVQLLEEGTPTARPTEAIELEGGLFQLLPTKDYDPEDEVWEFLPGSIVKCKMIEGLFGQMLLAVEKIK